MCEYDGIYQGLAWYYQLLLRMGWPTMGFHEFKPMTNEWELTVYFKHQDINCRADVRVPKNYFFIKGKSREDVKEWEAGLRRMLEDERVEVINDPLHRLRGFKEIQ